MNQTKNIKDMTKNAYAQIVETDLTLPNISDIYWGIQAIKSAGKVQAYSKS
jgi:hypothetical protein